MGAGAERTGSRGAADRRAVRQAVREDDAADAEAIWGIVQRPGMRFVALKSEERQAVLSVRPMRPQLVKIRGMQAYQVRNLLYEFGVVTRQGFAAQKATAAAVCLVPTILQIPASLPISLQPPSGAPRACRYASASGLEWRNIDNLYDFDQHAMRSIG